MSRRLIAWDLMSLDGFFEGPTKWDLGFHDTAWGEELEALSLEHADQTGALLFGRVTYAGMAAYWSKESGPIADYMNRVEKIVVSGSPLEPEWSNSRRLEGDVAEGVRALKAQAGKDLFVYGSAELTATLLQHGLIDELRICVAPILLGRGAPMFRQTDAATSLELLEARPLQTGAVVLRYRPKA